MIFNNGQRIGRIWECSICGKRFNKKKPGVYHVINKHKTKGSDKGGNDE